MLSRADLDVGVIGQASSPRPDATVVDESGVFLVDRMVETPSCVTDGPEAAVAAIGAVMLLALDIAGARREMVRAAGLDTPGPATADGVISVRGATNFAGPAWRGFDYCGFSADAESVASLAGITRNLHPCP